LRFGVSTEQKEYSRDGRVKKEDGKPVPMPKSKYEEDVYVNGHTTVWGSYFHKGAFKWGYGDDHSLLRSSYYTGMNGRKANDEANGMRFGTGGAGTAALEQQRAMLKAKPKNGDVTNKHVRKKQSDLYGDGTAGSTLDEKKLKEAIKKQKEFEKKGDTGGEEEKDDRKRKYNSMASVEVTAEEMEAYRMAKKRDEGGDLLDKIADTEELLEYK
jgi:pre-mRNA-processing factor SLU7